MLFYLIQVAAAAGSCDLQGGAVQCFFSVSSMHHASISSVTDGTVTFRHRERT